MLDQLELAEGVLRPGRTAQPDLVAQGEGLQCAGHRLMEVHPAIRWAPAAPLMEGGVGLDS
eukprot:4723455-Alexandrium_andersonii.AAC.1